jgi:octanoyl-[GcvH]:protein N-octanoyltransferase
MGIGEKEDGMLLQPFHILEEPLELHPGDVLYSFAWDEVVCRKVGEGKLSPMARIWRHPKAMVLGLRDRRLPYAAEAIDKLRRDGISVGVRNSGGAAVPLDPGVVNVSLIFPYTAGGKMDFHKEFRLMAGLIGDSIKEWSGESRSGEVRGAYCPGEYDLGIDGRKFCGIAQRRQLKAYVVSAFIVVDGSGAERGKRAQAFYREATGGIAHTDDPGVVPETMASLKELAGVPSAEAWIDSLKRRLELLGGRLSELPEEPVTNAEAAAAIEELKRRYDHS